MAKGTEELLEAEKLKNEALAAALEAAQKAIPSKASLTSDFEAPIFKVEGKTYKLNYGAMVLDGRLVTADEVAASEDLQLDIVTNWQGCVTEI